MRRTLSLLRIKLRDALVQLPYLPRALVRLTRCQRLAAGHNSIIITHRFTTARYAAAIHVMEGGRIVESRTQEELLALGGRYAKSWQAQMRKRETGGGTTVG